MLERIRINGEGKLIKHATTMEVYFGHQSQVEISDPDGTTRKLLMLQDKYRRDIFMEERKANRNKMVYRSEISDSASFLYGVTGILLSMNAGLSYLGMQDSTFGLNHLGKVGAATICFATSRHLSNNSKRIKSRINPTRSAMPDIICNKNK